MALYGYHKSTQHPVDVNNFFLLNFLLYFSRDPIKKKLTIEGTCSMAVDGQYEMSGRLLILPIEGKGDVHAKFSK